MAREARAQSQLAIWIPQALHRRLKLHCVTHDVPLMNFVAQAIEAKLAAEQGTRGRRRTGERVSPPA